MKETIYLPLADEPESEMIEIRSSINNALVGLLGSQGIYYWERRSNLRLVLPRSEILKYFQEKQVDPLQKLPN